MKLIMNKTRLSWLLWGGYLLFIVYGSLLPFKAHIIPIREAVEIFCRLPYHDLGPGNREDWIANIILYIPLAFIGCEAVRSWGVSPLFQVAFVLCVGSLTALGVEFLQVYFPGRTLALNDLIAEGLGSLIGAGSYLLFAGRLKGYCREILNHQPTSVRSALILYAIGFLVYSLFPFDFVLSGHELAIKIDQGRFAIFMIGVEARPVTLVLLKTLAEFMMVVPLGIAWGLFFPNRASFFEIVIAGIFLGASIEAAQFFLISGISQGLSVVVKCFGFASGCLWSGSVKPGFAAVLWKKCLRPGILVLFALFYSGALILANWFGRGPVETGQEMMIEIKALSLLPFYYHYYTSESRALLSLIAYFLLYLPLGMLFALKKRGPHRKIMGKDCLQAVFVAVIISSFLESGKVLLSKARPDITNVVISIVATLGGMVIVLWIERLVKPDNTGLNR